MLYDTLFLHFSLFSVLLFFVFLLYGGFLYLSITSVLCTLCPCFLRTEVIFLCYRYCVAAGTKYCSLWNSGINAFAALFKEQTLIYYVILKEQGSKQNTRKNPQRKQGGRGLRWSFEINKGYIFNRLAAGNNLKVWVRCMGKLRETGLKAFLVILALPAASLIVDKRK